MRNELVALSLGVILAGSSFAVRAEEPVTPAAASSDPAGELSSRWLLRIPEGDRVMYRGVVDLATVRAEMAPVLYPAPNAAGAIAALLTHGLLIESAKRRQKSALEEAADEVLLPYRGVLDSFGYPELMARALDKAQPNGSFQLADPAAAPSEGAWIVESAPVYSLTQDQRSLILDNVVVIYARNEPGNTAYRNAIRVVAPPAPSAEPLAYWTAEEGARLKEESAALLAASLGIAIDDRKSGSESDEAPYRTIRYPEGGIEKMERARVVREYCDRTLLRTLRGNLMLVPVRGHPGTSGDTAVIDACRHELSAANAPTSD